MSELNSRYSQPQRYRIVVAGQLGDSWQSWLEDLDIQVAGEQTIIEGILVDQSALFGLLKKIRNLGLPLVSVNHSDFY